MPNFFASAVSHSHAVSVHTVFGASLAVRLSGNAAEKLPRSCLGSVCASRCQCPLFLDQSQGLLEICLLRPFG